MPSRSDAHQPLCPLGAPVAEPLFGAGSEPPVVVERRRLGKELVAAQLAFQVPRVHLLPKHTHTCVHTQAPPPPP